MDYDKLYKKRHEIIRDGLLSKWNEFKKENDSRQIEDLKREFLNELGEALLLMVHHKNGNIGYAMKFRERLKDKFLFREHKFKEQPVTNFMKHVLPELRKSEQQSYEKSNAKELVFDRQFLFEASEDEIIEFLASYVAHKEVFDYIHQSREDTVPSEFMSPRKKIEWKGKTKELAELFVELKEKGWIDDHTADVIYSCFKFKSNAKEPLTLLRKYLTPTYDRLKEASYAELYVHNYHRQFNSIKHKSETKEKRK